MTQPTSKPTADCIVAAQAEIHSNLVCANLRGRRPCVGPLVKHELFLHRGWLQLRMLAFCRAGQQQPYLGSISRNYYSYVCSSAMRSKTVCTKYNMQQMAWQRIPNIKAPTQHPRWWNARSCQASAVADSPCGRACNSCSTSWLRPLMPSNCRHAIEFKSSGLRAARSDARTSLSPRRRRPRCSQHTHTGNISAY